MALLLENTSSNELVFPAYKDTVFAMTGYEIISEQQDVYNFKYILKLIVNYQEVAILKSPLYQNYDYGVFNIEQVLQDLTKTDVSGYANYYGGLQPQSTRDGVPYNDTNHSIHHIDAFARNRDNLNILQFEIAASWYDGNGNFTQLQFKRPKINKNKLLDRYYFFNGIQQHSLGDVWNFKPYVLDGSTKKFITNQSPTFERNLRLTDYQTLAFFNGKFCTSQAGGHGYVQNCESSLVKYIYAKGLDESGATLFTGVWENNDTNGGSYFPNLSTAQLIPQTHPLTDKGLLYVGIGCKNIIDHMPNQAGGVINASDFDNVVKYQVYASNSAGAIISERYSFVIKGNDCKGYETIRIAYLNRLGAWDYVNFNKKSTQSTDITRSNFKQNYGYAPIQQNGANSGNKWDYGKWQGGTKTYNVNAINTIEANSDWINEEHAITLEELFTSPDTYIQDGAEFIPVVITEKNYTKQTKANDKLIQYVVSIQLGHETRIQRL